MAAPTLTLLNSTSISTAESITGWTKYDTLDTDIKKEGSNSITGTFRTDATVGYFDNGSAPVTAAGKTFRKWINTTNLPYMDTEANGGYELLMYDGTTTEYKTMFGSDTYFGGWFNCVFDCDSFTTLTLANVQRWGLRIQHTASAKNIDNVWTDAYKYLDGYSMTGGTAIDPITLTDIEEADRGTTTLYGYGVVTLFGGVFYCTGDMQFGTGATTMHFKMDGEILVFEDKPVASGLYSLSGVGTGSTVTIQNSSTITSAGTTDATRYVFDWSDTNLLSFTCTDSLIVRASTSTFKSGQTVTGNTFNDCRQITHGGADMDNCTVKNYEGTADTSALIYNINADPDGEMDGMTFEKGTAATHAIEFGLLSPLTMTLRDVTCTGYNAADTQNDSTFHFKRTSGTVTLNLIGYTGNATYRSDGATINLVISPVTVKVHVDDNEGASLQSAQVWLKAEDGTGELPFEQAITSITRVTTTATVTFTAAHGLKTNDYLDLDGITDKTEDNWGAHQVTVTGSTTCTYTTTDSGSTNYTGTIIGTGGLLYGTTDVNGDISISRSFTGNQPVAGYVAKSTSSPRLKRYDLAGNTVNSSTGLTVNARMILDE